LDGYTDGGHIDINSALYGKEAMTPEIQRDIDLIDSGAPKFSFDRDAIAYSGTKAKHYEDWNVWGHEERPGILEHVI